MSVLVVGASAAGLSTVEALRRLGYQDPITILGAEQGAPYDRPPISKQYLRGEWDADRTRLRPDSMLAALRADFILGDPAASLDISRRLVRSEAGRQLSADAIVIATGLHARVLPYQAGLDGVHVLRTLNDATALRAELHRGSNVVVVGDGVLGAEAAATAHQLGCAVTLTGRQSAPLERQFGPMVAGLIAQLHIAEGVELRLGTTTVGLTSSAGRVDGVLLADGDHLPAEVVIVAIGGEPATEWLADSGLQLDSGIVCDSRCRAADGIYAAGDVARWYDENQRMSVRLENRTNATEQAVCVAANIMGESRSYTPIPYFWSDQFTTKIQAHGFYAADADVAVVEGTATEHRFVAHYRRGDEVIAVLGWNMPKQIRLHKQQFLMSK